MLDLLVVILSFVELPELNVVNRYTTYAHGTFFAQDGDASFQILW